jgi:ATP-dependent Clp protease ATP-binding subunit ClpB
LLKKQSLFVFLEDSALQHLAQVGYEPAFGARPLRRVLQKELVNNLSKQILLNNFEKGDTIVVTADAKGLNFQKRKA